MKIRNHVVNGSALFTFLTVAFFASTLWTTRAATLVQEFYLPMPEQQIYQANAAIVPGTPSTNFSTFSIVVTGDGTTIYYDQWEDGYEVNLGSPAQSTTKVWGDGNNANGICPGFTNDPAGLSAGTVITLTNNVPLPRNPSVFLWDARDRVAATKALVISRAAWPMPTGPVFAGAVGVLSTLDYGTNFVSPVGQDQTNVNLFKYVGLFVMAAQNNTAITLDPNGNGVGTSSIVLNQGESYLINGGVKKGGRITASKPVQADLLVGHVGASYASDWFTLYPVESWDNNYYTPVSSAASGTQPAYVYLFNPATNAITINYNTRAGGGSFAIPGTNGVYQFPMPIGSGASFASAGGQNFFPICTVAANNSSDTAYNWGFTLVPKTALTTEATVGWGPGSADGTVNGSPVWVTTLGSTTVYVDYKGDKAGPLTDPNGGKYDTNFTVVNLQALKIYDPSKNQTGMRVYTTDGTLLTAAWGEDADVAQPGNPYIDAGTTVLPFPVPVLYKSAVIVTDTVPVGLSLGDTIQYTVQVDNKGLLPLGNTVVIDAPSTNLTYVTNSTTWNGTAIPDSVSGTPFPLDAPGFNIPVILSRGTSTFQYKFRVIAAGTISNSVNIGGSPISTTATLAPAPTNGVSVNVRFTDTGGNTVLLYAAGGNVFVTLTNAVGNTSSNSIQTLLVTVTDPTSGDAETITLTETGVNTGVFRNVSGLPISLTSGLVSQDGTLKVSPGDTLNVSYTEPSYGSSSSATAAIQIPAQTKQLYLSVNGSTNGVQALNRVNPIATAHGPTRTSIDIGSGGSGTVTTDATASGNTGAATNKTLTISHTTGAGASRLMIVGIGFGAPANDTTLGGVSNVLYGATQLTRLTNVVDSANRSQTELWYLLNPPSGTANVVVNMTNNTQQIVAGVTTFSGVNQATPFGPVSTNWYGTTTAARIGCTNIVTTAANELVYQIVSWDGNGSAYTNTAAAGQTQLWSSGPSTNAIIAGASTKPGSASPSTNWWTLNTGRRNSSVALSIKPAGGGGGGPATNVASFAQTPVFCSAFTMPSNNLVTITNYLTLTNGSLTANPDVTARLFYGATNFLTLTNPVYLSASNTLVWSAVLSSNVIVPAGAAISYTISNGVSGTAFHVDYDSTNKPSKISLPAATVIAINTFGIYDAPYPNGSIVTTPVAGSTLYVRAGVSDPFGSYDITSLGLAVTAPNIINNFNVTLNDASLVASDSCSKTYEYVWTTGPATGNYAVVATANEGTEGVTAVASTGISTIFLDLGTPSTTEFTSGNNGGATNSYLANSSVCVRVTDINRDTNAATAQTIIATVTSSGGDSEIVTLTETGTNTGIFTACLTTSTNASVIPNNGTLTAPVGSILTVNYTDDTDPSDSTSATATIQPLPGVPGLSISKTIVSPTGGQVGVGQPVVYNLQIVNVGSTTLPSLRITDTFTASRLSYVSASLTPNTVAAGTLTWTNLGAFAPGQSTNIIVNFTTLATGTATNSATANGSTVTNSSSVLLTVNSAALNVTKILLAPTNQPVAVGSNVTFRITIKNVGNTVIPTLPFEDTYSGAYYQYVSATIPPNGSGFGTLIWTNLAVSALATNAILTNDVTMKVVGQGSPANNTATVDYAFDIFGNPVPVASSTIGITTASAAVNGRVYNDINQLGSYTNGMTGLSGVTIQLFTDPNGDGDPSDGSLVQLTTTDGGGYYELLNVNLGKYVVVETDLPGYSSSAPVNNRLPLNLTSLTTYTNNNFFDYQPAPSLYSTFSGRVLNDVLGTGTNTSQAGLGYVAIDLVQDVNTNGLADLGEPVASSTVTDTNGNYSLSGITPGRYVIRETDNYGYYSTGDSQPPNDNQISFVTTNGIVSTNRNFFDRLSPIAVNDTNATTYFVPVTIRPLTNDLSPNGDALTISNATSAFGIVIINPGSTNLTFTPTNVGTATITYTIADAHGGTGTAVITVGVSPAPLTLTANSTGKIYGQTVTFVGTEFTVVGLTNGNSVSSVTLNSAGTVNTAIVGNYPIIPSAAVGSGLANYAITYATNGTLTVSPATLGITANNTNRLYNTANPAFTYTASGFLNGDTTSVLSGAPSLTTPALISSPLGTYPIAATNGTLSATNYLFSFTNGLLSVNLAAPLVVWPTPTNIMYGTVLGTNQNNATSSVPGSYVYNPTNGVVLPVGTNTLTVIYTPGNTNYGSTNLSVQLVVTPAPLSVTASNVSRVYGQTNPVLSGTLLGVVNGDNITATYSTTATTNSPAGGYPIVPALVDPNSRLVNYAVVTNNATLTVSKAVLGITANATNRVYGVTNPVFAYTASGFVNNDTASVLSGAPSLTTEAVTNSPVGTYPIVATNGTLSATNYSFNFTNGTLTVARGSYGITWTNPASITYGTLLGTNQNNATATVPGSLVYSPTNGMLLPAGTNLLTVVFTPSNTNYATTNVSVSLVVTPALLTVTASNQAKFYGQALSLGTAAFTANGLVNSETIGGVTLTSAGAVTNAGAGTYAIVPSAATGGTFNPSNYSLTYSNGTLTVSPAALTVSANSTNKIYGAANPAFTASYSGFVNGDTSGVLTGSPSLTTAATTNSGAGGYTIVATNGTLSAANYAFSFVNGTLTVNQATLTVTANSTNKIYGATNPSFTASYGGFVNGETTSVLSGSPSLTTTATLSSPAGNYPITATNGTLSAANYAFAFVNGSLTVIGGNYGITWTNPASIVYGTLLGTNQNNASATVAGNYTYNPTNGTLLPAGTNALSVVFTPSDTNYTSTNLSVQLIVTPAPLTITANSTNKIYNTTLTLGTTAFTSSGLVNGQTIGGVSLSSAGTLSSAPVGTYPITPSNATGGTFNLANYSLTYSNGTLTVLGAGYTATWPTPTNIVYGTVLGTNQNNATTSIPGTFTYNPTNGVVLPAGTNALSVVFIPGDTNYASTNLSVQLVVTPAPLTITANSTNKIYNTTLTLGSGQTAFASSGLVNGDTVTSVTLASAGAAGAAPVGTYPIIPSVAVGSGLTNYNIGYSNGTLSVLNGSYGISWTNPVSIIYGTPLSTNQNNATATVPGGYVYNPTNGTVLSVGTNILSVVFTPGDTNYIATNLTVKLVVTPAPLSITASNATRLYGQVNPSFGGTLTGILNGDNITATYAASATTNSPVGNYPIIPTLIDPNGRLVNYTVTTNNGTLTIGQATLTVTANNTNRIYGAANPTFSASYAGFVNGETTGVLSGSPSLTTSTTTNSGVGGYSITATNGTLSAANYVFNFVNGTLTVGQATLTVTANSTNRLYNTANPTFTASYAGFVNGDTASVLSGTPSLTTTALISSPAGSYPITATNGTLSAANYAFAFVNGSLTIIGGNYGITWTNPESIVYGTPLSTNQNNASATVGGGYTYNPTNGTVLPAGTNLLSVIFTPSDTNYAGTNLSVFLVVTPAPLTITANSTNKLYNTTLTLGTTAFTSSGLVNGDSVSNVTLASAGTIASAPVGTYPIIPSAAVGSGLTNYSLAYSNGTLAVLNGAYAITWTNPVSVVYGTPLSTSQNNATATVPGGYVYNPTNGTVLPTGTNTLSLVFSPTDTNYAATNLTVKLVVTPAPLTVTGSNVFRIYGQPNPSLSGNLTGVVNSDNITASYTTLATSNSPTGAYPIVPTLVDPNSRLTNYNVTTNNGTLTVTPASLNITANNTNRIYGAANPAFTYTASGFVNGDTASVLSGAPSLTTTAVTNSPVGTYAIAATNGTLSATNYVFSFASDTLTVTLGNYGIIWTNPVSIVYGAPLSTNQNNATATVGGGYVYNPTNGTVLPSGTNVLTVVFTPANTNYAGTNVSVPLVVTPAPLTVTGSNVFRIYGQSNPVLGGTLTGIQNGDNITATYATTATSNSPTGAYPIVPSLVDPNSRLVNYAVTTNNGTLTVSPAILGITANPTNRLYGAANPVFTYTANGFVNGDTASVLSGAPSLTTAAVTNSPVGTYAIVATNGTLSATNYSFSFTNGLLSVNLAAPLVIWPTPTNIVYGTPLGTNQNNATSTVPGSVVYTPTNGTVLPVGTNTLSVVYTPTDTNYASTNLTVPLVVTPAALTVTANNASRVVGQPNPIFTGVLAGVVNGDNIIASYATTATTNSPVGIYPIVPSLADPNSRLVNYSVTTNNGTLTITNAPLVADLVVVQSGPTSGIAGSNLVFTVSVTNRGPQAATSVMVTNQLASGFNFVSASAAGANSGGTVTWNFASLPVNGVTNLTVTVFAAEGGAFTNIASGAPSLTDTNAANNDGSQANAKSHTLISALADVTVFKVGETNGYRGAAINYTITATNAGPSTATNVVVQDNLPAGLVLQSASGSYTATASAVTWSGVTLAPGTFTNYSISLVVTSTITAFTNIAFSTSPTADPNPTNNNGSFSKSRVATKVAPSADLVVLLVGPPSALQGSNFVYTLTITNAGPSTSSNIVVSDSLPLSLIFVSASSGGKATNNIVTWPLIKALPVGGSTNYTLTVKAPSGGIFTNLASALAATFDPNATNNSGVSPASQALTEVAPAQLDFLAGTPVFNPQTGLFEENVIVTNIGSVTILGFRLYVSGLTGGITLYNATGTANGLPYVDYTFPLDPSNHVTVKLELFSPLRVTPTNSISVVPILPAGIDLSSTNRSVAVSKVFTDTRNDDTRFVIEFASVPGKTYNIIYSSDLVTWKVATPSVTASGNVTQWYDDGPPKTESKPSSVGQRFYRVIKF
jgi:hypothetical protein